MAFSYGSIAHTDRTKERPEDSIAFLSILHEKNHNGFVAVADKGFSGQEWNQKMHSLSNLNGSCFYFSKDSYVSVNVFKSKENRTVGNCQTINGIFLDLDIHNTLKEDLTKEEILKESDKVLSVLSELTEQGVFPKANAVVFTGRGLALYYLYDEPLNASDETAVNRHKELYNQAMDYLQVLFAKNNLLIKMDRSVRDAARYCRIPGTKNTSAGEYSVLMYTNFNRYTLDSLHFEEVDKSLIASSTPSRKKTGKKRKDVVEKKKTTKKNIKKKTETSTTGVKLTGKQTYAPAWAVNLSARRMEQIEAVMRSRGGNDGDFREVALFLYYNSSKVVHSEEDSVEFAKRLNDSFSEPLSDAVFTSCLNGTNFHKESGVWAEIKRCHSDGIYTFKNETIARLLSLSEEECDEIGLFKRQNEKKRAEENKKTKALKKEAAVLMRQNGASYKEISEKIGVCRDTLTRWFKPLGLVCEQKKEKNEKTELEDPVSDFSVNKKRERKEKVVFLENKDHIVEKSQYPVKSSPYPREIVHTESKNAVCRVKVHTEGIRKDRGNEKIREKENSRVMIHTKGIYSDKGKSTYRIGTSPLLGLSKWKVFPYSRGASW